MTATSPTSADLREAVARVIDRSASLYGDADYYGPSLDKATYSARLRVALKTADAILTGPIASHIAEIEAERDDAKGAAALNLAVLKQHRSEVTRLTAALAAATAALEPFAKEAARIDPPEWSDTIGDRVQVWQSGPPDITHSHITYGDLRRARSTLDTLRTQGGERG